MNEAKMGWTPELSRIVAKALKFGDNPSDLILSAARGVADPVLDALLSTPAGQRALVAMLEGRGVRTAVCLRCRGAQGWRSQTPCAQHKIRGCLSCCDWVRCPDCHGRGAVIVVPGEGEEARNG